MGQFILRHRNIQWGWSFLYRWMGSQVEECSIWNQVRQRPLYWNRWSSSCRWSSHRLVSTAWSEQAWVVRRSGKGHQRIQGWILDCGRYRHDGFWDRLGTQRVRKNVDRFCPQPRLHPETVWYSVQLSSHRRQEAGRNGRGHDLDRWWRRCSG